MLCCVLSLLTGVHGGNRVLTSVSSSGIVDSRTPMTTRAFLIRLSTRVSQRLAALAKLLDNTTSRSLSSQRMIRGVIRRCSLRLRDLGNALAKLRTARGRTGFRASTLLTELGRLVDHPSPTAPRSDRDGTAGNRHPSSGFTAPLHITVTSAPGSTVYAGRVSFSTFPHAPALRRLKLSGTTLTIMGSRHRNVVRDPVGKELASRVNEDDLGGQIRPSDDSVRDSLDVGLERDFKSVSTSVTDAIRPSWTA